MDTKISLMNKYFNRTSFCAGQEEVIDALISGRDVIAVMPPNQDKTICYLIAALMLEGMTIVVSPDKYDIKEQVKALTSSGISAATLSGTLNINEYMQIQKNAVNNMYKILYVEPEKLTTSGVLEICSNVNLSMLVIEKAQCISQLGYKYDPNYLYVKELIYKLSTKPIIGAFASSATKEVCDDIVETIELDDPFVITTGYDRPDFYFSVIQPKSKINALIDLIRENKDEPGIVYCSTRKNVDWVWDRLTKSGIDAAKYHRGLSEDERNNNRNDILNNIKHVMVTTNSFTLDDPKASYIIHYNMPKSIESYYREITKAARCGSKVKCILLYDPNDVEFGMYIINNSNNYALSKKEQAFATQKAIERLNLMTQYATTNECLRSYILNYFGEEHNDRCGNCSNCLKEFENIDITIEAQKILSCIYRVQQKYGRSMICDILQGNKNDRIASLEFDKLSTYGIMSDVSKSDIYAIIDHLINKGCISVSDNEYPVLALTLKSIAVLKGEQTLVIKKLKDNNLTAAKTKINESKSSYPKEILNNKPIKALEDEPIVLPKEEPKIIITDNRVERKVETFTVNSNKVVDSAQNKETLNSNLSATTIDNNVSESEYKPVPLSAKDAPCTLGDIVTGIFLSDISAANKYTLVRVNKWLVSTGMLEEVDLSEHIKCYFPTEKGKELGISTLENVSKAGNKFFDALYNKNAQQYIIDNLDAIAEFDKK